MTKFCSSYVHPTFGFGTIFLVLLFFLEAFKSLLENEKSEENIDIAFSPQNSARESRPAVIISGMARGGGEFRTMAMQHPRGRIGADWSIKRLLSFSLRK